MRVKFSSKVYESDNIINPANIGKELYVSTPNGTYQVTCSSEIEAENLYNMAFEKGFVDFTDMEYTNDWR